MNIKVYLGDLFHTWTGGGQYTMPLNIGYVGSYLKQQMKLFNVDTKIRLFKDANKIIETISTIKLTGSSTTKYTSITETTYTKDTYL